MNLLLTFYNIRGRRLTVANGFSFVRHLIDGRDLFINESASSDEIAQGLRNLPFDVERIYCSVSMVEQWRLIQPLIDERWVLGGPAIAMLINRNALGDDAARATFVKQPFEYYLGSDELSSTFTAYFGRFAAQNWTGRIIYNCSLAIGCTWNHCNFCSYRDYLCEQIDGIVYRPDIKGILQQLPALPIGDAIVNLCGSSFDVDAMAQILDSEVPSNVALNLFTRADAEILQLLQQQAARFHNAMIFNIGLESFAQNVVDKLQKGVRVDDVIALTEMVVKRGAMVQLSIMDHFAFFDRDCLQQGLDALARLRVINERFPRHISLSNNGITRWYHEDVAKRLCGPVMVETDGTRQWYQAVISPDSDVFACNQAMARAIKSSGIHMREDGHFASLSDDIDAE